MEMTGRSVGPTAPLRISVVDVRIRLQCDCGLYGFAIRSLITKASFDSGGRVGRGWDGMGWDGMGWEGTARVRQVDKPASSRKGADARYGRYRG